TKRIATRLRKFRPFKEARAFVHNLGLNNGDAWRAYCQSGEKPNDIPAPPERVYRNRGWIDWGDWLGTGPKHVGWMTFRQARSFACKLGFKNQNQWFAYAKSGKKPKDIPSSPSTVYGGDGWAGWGDWLGTGATATHLREYLSFDEARKFVRQLG